jgi:ketosteroid isomerase-like protein
MRLVPRMALRQTFRRFSGVVFSAIVIVCASAPAHADSSDARAIRTLMESYRHSFEGRNLNGIMAVYASGSGLFVFDAVPPRDYPSADAYRKDWQGILSAFPGPVHDEVQQFAVTVVGDVAYGHHVQNVRLTRKNASVWHVVLRLTDVYRRINGRWLIVQEHVSWPVDPMTGKADFLSKP